MLVSVFTEKIKVDQAQVISWKKLHQWISLLSLCVHLEQSQCRYLINPTYTLFVVVSCKRGEPMQWPCTPMPWELHSWIILELYFMFMLILLQFKIFVLCWQMAATSDISLWSMAYLSSRHQSFTLCTPSNSFKNIL